MSLNYTTNGGTSYATHDVAILVAFTNLTYVQMTFSKQVAIVKALALTTVVLVLVGPMLLGVWVAFGSDPTQWFSVLTDVLSNARVETIEKIVLRATTIASIGTMLAIPIGVRIATLRSPTLAFSAIALLITPFFVNDAIKDYAWAAMLIGLHQFLAHSSSGVLSVVAQYVSPYSSLAPYLPLTVSAIPIIALIVAAGYVRAVVPNLRFFLEITPKRGRLLTAVTIPLLAPYIFLGWLLAFGITIPSSAEEQYLGGGVANNLQTLMESLVRTNIAATLLFGVITVTMAGLVAWIATSIFTSTNRKISSPWTTITTWANRLCGRLRFMPTDRTDGMVVPLCGGGDRKLYSRRCWGIYVITVIVISWLPIVAMFSFGLVQCDQSRCGLTISILESALTSPRAESAIGTSLELGIVAAVSGLAFGIIGLWMAIADRISRRSIFVALFALLVPAQAVAIALGQLARLIGIEQGSLALVVPAHIVLVFPYCLLIGAATGMTLPKRAILSLQEFGARADSTIRRVITRYGASAFASAAMFGFILSLNDQIRVSYLGGTKEALSTLVNAYLYAGQIGQSTDAFGLSMALLLSGLICLVLAALWGYRIAQRRS